MNDADLRIKVLQSDDKGESVMKCIGNLKSSYIYDTNSFRQTTAGTGTVFHVGSNGETFVITCAHNVRRLVYECGTCGIYMEKKQQHGSCNINDLNTKRYERAMHDDENKREIIEYGDTENVYECDINNIFINEEMYSLYPSGSSGYDLCVLKFIKNTNDYKKLVKNIRIENGKKTISEIGHFQMW